MYVRGWLGHPESFPHQGVTSPPTDHPKSVAQMMMPTGPLGTGGAGSCVTSENLHALHCYMSCAHKEPLGGILHTHYCILTWRKASATRDSRLWWIPLSDLCKLQSRFQSPLSPRVIIEGHQTPRTVMGPLKQVSEWPTLQRTFYRVGKDKTVLTLKKEIGF